MDLMIAADLLDEECNAAANMMLECKRANTVRKFKEFKPE
jgi:hypothetical protein